MPSPRTNFAIALLTTLLPLSPAALAGMINAQFGCTAGTSCHGASHSSVQMTGAAVVGSAGDQWNLLSGATGIGVPGSNVALLDTGGSATGVSLSWTGFEVYVPTNGQIGAFGSTAFAPLMNSYLVAKPSSPASMTILGLAANSEYALYIVTQGDRNANNRTTTFSVNGGSPFTTAPTNANANTFISGQNYKLFDVFADANGIIQVSMTSTNEGTINGFQLVGAVPEPGTVFLCLGGGALLLLGRLRRK